MVVVVMMIKFNLLTCRFNSTSAYYKASTKTQINTYNNGPRKDISSSGQALPSAQLTCVQSTSACVQTLSALPLRRPAGSCCVTE
jgi:hypothetical protein